MSYFILIAILLGMVVLAAPITLGYDSGEKWFKVRWLGLALTKRLGVAKPGKPPRSIAGKKKPTRRRIAGRTLMRRLWERRELCLELFGRIGRFALEVVRTLSFRDSAAGFSLPDPMLNGLLYALVANINLEKVNLSVNFADRNYARIWVTVYPYRVTRKLAALLLHLPYIRMLRFALDLKKSGQGKLRGY